MRIVSKYSDYYDGIQGYAPDADDLVYVRYAREYAVGWRDHEERRKANQHELVAMLRRCAGWTLPVVESMQRGVIHFCGKRYPFWYKFDPTAKGRQKTQGFYDYDSLLAHLAKQEYAAKDPVYRRLTGKDKKPKARWNNYHLRRHWETNLTRRSWDDYMKRFELKNAREHRDDAVFRYFNTPVIVYYESENRVVINERLNQFSFAKMVDPFTAFQELSMFIGNNLANVEDPDDLVMTDEQRAATKGFDKWSFRKKVR